MAHQSKDYENLLQVFGAKRFSSAFSIGRLGYGRFYQAFSNKNVSERQKGKFSLDDSTEMDLGSVMSRDLGSVLSQCLASAKRHARRYLGKNVSSVSSPPGYVANTAYSSFIPTTPSPTIAFTSRARIVASGSSNGFTALKLTSRAHIGHAFS